MASSTQGDVLNPFSIGFLLFPGVTQLDLTGPWEVFSRAPGAQVHLIWKTREIVQSDKGMGIQPTATFTDCPPLDLICVPGGPGQIPLMDDSETLQFLRERAQQARFITAVCTGALVLGAAGLLHGYQATTHWASLDQLALLGAIPLAQRVVRDGNRITGAGVTSGIDFALSVISDIWGADIAQGIQLQLEYAPQPPFNSGTPGQAPRDVLAQVQHTNQAFARQRLAVTRHTASHQAKQPGCGDGWHIAVLENGEYMPLRQQVLWPDKPLAFSAVPGDNAALHFGVYHTGKLICCLSAFALAEGLWQIRKFATVAEWQRKGFGTILLATVIKQLEQQGALRFELDARQTACEFYEKLGFSPCSAPFEKSGLPYIRMARQVLT